MQLARATADGILIPWRKGEPERFKTAGELLVIDKGGLTFMPPWACTSTSRKWTSPPCTPLSWRCITSRRRR